MNKYMQKISTYPFRHPLGDCTNNGLTSVGDSFDLYFDFDSVDNIPDDSLVLIKSVQKIQGSSRNHNAAKHQPLIYDLYTFP